MKKLTASGAVLTLFLVTFASTSSFCTVLGKNVNVPEGTSIFYWSGANTTINAPSSFKIGAQPVQISILAFDNLGGSLGTGDTLLLTAIIPVSGKPTAFPWAIITTNEEAAVVQKQAFKGTPVYITNTVGGADLNNIFIVTKQQLSVARHGNSITVDFNPTSTITLKFPNTPWWPVPIPNPNPPPTTIPAFLYSLVLPAFHLTVEKYGGSIHTEQSKTFESTPIPGFPPIVLSGYTLASDTMGFYADATFTCPSWSAPVKVQTASDAMVTMHGINTVIPP